MLKLKYKFRINKNALITKTYKELIQQNYLKYLQLKLYSKNTLKYRLRLTYCSQTKVNIK